MIRYGELDQAIAVYICKEVHDTIPVAHYRRAVKTAIKMHNNGQHWDMQQSAAVLLYFAFNDGHLHPSQLTVSGLEALDFAEKILQETKTSINLADEMSDYSLKLIQGGGDK
jgi:hypothetical protein